MTSPAPNPIPGGGSDRTDTDDRRRAPDRTDTDDRRRAPDRTGPALIAVGHLIVLALAFATDLTLGLAASAMILIIVGVILGHG